MNTRAHMSKFAQKWANKHVGDDITRMESAGVTPTQDHKTILGWLRGNEMGMLASFFLDCVTGGHANGIRDFYIDARVSGKPVITMYSGYVGKRDVNAALRRLQAARHNPGFGDYLAAGRRHLATGLTKAAEEAQRAAERARAAADREAKRRQCDAPTPEQALRVLAQAVGVAKLNPRNAGQNTPGLYPISSLKKGEFFKRKPDARKVYVKGDYDRSERTYTGTDTEDISRAIYLKGTTRVYVGFDY